MSYYAVQQNNTQKLRQQQLNIVLQLFKNARVIQDGVVDIPLVINNTQVGFRVQLPPQFPHQAPIITCLVQAKHQNLDQYGRVVHPKLQHWRPHENLGEVLQEIFYLFVTKPFTVLNYMPPSNLGNVNINVQTNVVHQQKPQVSPVSPNMIPQSFKEVNALTSQECQQLLNDPAAFESFFENLEAVKNIKQVANQLEQANVEQAKKHLSYEEEYNKLKNEVLQTQAKLIEIHKEYDKKFQQQQQVLGKYAPQFLLEAITKKTKESDAESSAIADDFLSGKIDVKEFIEKFQKSRELYHIRKAKRERFAQTQGLKA